jgi:hypothetical protein
MFFLRNINIHNLLEQFDMFLECVYALSFSMINFMLNLYQLVSSYMLTINNYFFFFLIILVIITNIIFIFTSYEI